ncbi:hypothetical protein MPSEU_000378800 [Mayamaea pseudoterrestris]|nr:hypothetical protein MPSEU_000378800 [Mayamaea pseudoterrestris]
MSTDSGNHLTLVGSVEVYYDGKENAHCIRCLPPDSNSELQHLQKDDIVERREDNEKQSVSDETEIENGFIESLTTACANTCACQCAPYYTKSILKTSDSRNLGSASIIQRRQVSFSRHEIREFDLTLGHHPAAAHGPPVMLDYESQGKKCVVDVDEYEKERGPPRTRRQLKINAYERKQILTQAKGFTEAEVNEAWAEALQIRRQRQETLNRGLIMMAYDDISESMSRKYTRMLHSLGL